MKTPKTLLDLASLTPRKLPAVADAPTRDGLAQKEVLNPSSWYEEVLMGNSHLVEGYGWLMARWYHALLEEQS